MLALYIINKHIYEQPTKIHANFPQFCAHDIPPKTKHHASHKSLRYQKSNVFIWFVA